MWYLFGIIKLENPEKCAAGGFAGHPLRAIPFQEIAIVTQELPVWDIDECQKADLLQKLLTHQKTLEKIMQETFVLPIKFGCVVDSLQDIQSILKRGYPLFCQAIQELNGKIEINLTVTWDVSDQLKTIAVGDSKIKAMKEEAALGGKKELFLAVGQALEGKLGERRQNLATQIFQKLDNLHEGRVDHECLEDRMVLNTSFLVSKEKEESFSAAVRQCDQDLQGALYFKCLMPLPPHSFRTIAIQKVSPEALLEATKLFEVGPETTLEELKGKNRQLIQQFHPDRKPDSKEEIFSLIHQSFGLLRELYELEEKPFANMNSNHPSTGDWWGHCFSIGTIQGESP